MPFKCIKSVYLYLIICSNVLEHKHNTFSPLW